MWDKAIESHFVFLLQRFHQAESLVESQCQKSMDSSEVGIHPWILIISDGRVALSKLSDVQNQVQFHLITTVLRSTVVVHVEYSQVDAGCGHGHPIYHVTM